MALTRQTDPSSEQPTAEALLTLIMTLCEILALDWSEHDRSVIQRRINNAIAHALRIGI